METGVFRGRATLEYAVEEWPGAKHLLVAFPAMRPGSARPPTGRRRQLEGIHAHRLYLGSDEHHFLGPHGQLAGMHSAVELIRAQADDLRVRQERVVCVGTSSAAAFALLIGLMYGAGRIIVGGAPVRAGTLLARIRTEATGRKSAVSTLLDHATPAGGDPIAYLDRLIFDAAARATAPCRIDMITSERDYALDATLEFEECARRNPVLRCHAHFEAYDHHARVADSFYPLLHELLAPRGAARPA
jgi:hypothetical protein